MFATSSGLQTRPSGIEPKIFSRRSESEPLGSASTLDSLIFSLDLGTERDGYILQESFLHGCLAYRRPNAIKPNVIRGVLCRKTFRRLMEKTSVSHD